MKLSTPPIFPLYFKIIYGIATSTYVFYVFLYFLTTQVDDPTEYAETVTTDLLSFQHTN